MASADFHKGRTVAAHPGLGQPRQADAQKVGGLFWSLQNARPISALEPTSGAMPAARQPPRESLSRRAPEYSSQTLRYALI